MWRVGIDVGGTFTDLFAWSDTNNEQRTAKTLTTKPRSLDRSNERAARRGNRAE